MDARLAQDKEIVRYLLENTLEASQLYLDTIEQRPPATHRDVSYTLSLPDTGMGADATLAHFMARHGHAIAATSGPRFWGFVTGGTTPAALMGDWLVSAFDANLSDRSGSGAGEVEDEAIQLLRELFDLPKVFEGVFVSGATMANFVALAIAREWVGEQRGVSVADEGIYEQAPIPVFSAEPHSSTIKSLAMLGMGRIVNRIANLPGNREAMDPADLRRYLEGLQGTPAIVVASAGTVNSADFDDFEAIGHLKQEFPFWLHVDAAFGGFAACSPHYQHLMAGIEYADSITIDAHKWLNVPYDSAMVFTRHRDLQMEVFRNGAAYLDTGSTTPDFFHLTPENSRRFRALPAWFTLMAYGKAGYQDIVERNAANATRLTECIENSSAFRLLAPTRFNIVCFTLNSESDPTREEIRAFLDALLDDGRVFLTPTQYQGTWGIRAAFVNWRTDIEDVNIAWEALEQIANRNVQITE